MCFNEDLNKDGLMLSQQHFTRPTPINSDQDWTKLAESLLNTLEDLDILLEPA